MEANKEIPKLSAYYKLSRRIGRMAYYKNHEAARAPLDLTFRLFDREAYRRFLAKKFKKSAL